MFEPKYTVKGAHTRLENAWMLKQQYLKWIDWVNGILAKETQLSTGVGDVSSDGIEIRTPAGVVFTRLRMFESGGQVFGRIMFLMPPQPEKPHQASPVFAVRLTADGVWTFGDEGNDVAMNLPSSAQRLVHEILIGQLAEEQRRYEAA